MPYIDGPFMQMPDPKENPMNIKSPTIFGREPAVVLGFAQALLTFLLAFALGVSQESYGPWLAVVTAALGVYVAAVTKDTLLGVIVALTKAGVVLVAVYGLTFTDQQTAAIIGAVSMIITFVQRNGTSPIEYEPEHA